MIQRPYSLTGSRLLIPFAVLSATLVAGCGPSGSNQTSEPQQSGSPTAAAPPFASQQQSPNGGLTPLIQAAQKGNSDEVKQLIAKATDANESASDGTTPLMHAANAQVAQLLLEKGAKIDAKDKLGRTALIHASGDNDRVIGGRGGVTAENDDALVKLLLSHHADPNVISQDGTTALLAAISHHKVVSGPYDISGSENARVKKVRLLLDAGANVNTQTPAETEDHLRAGATPIIAAAINGDPALVQLLIDKGADINVKDQTGNTALIYAARNGKPEVVQLLIAKHADVNVHNQQGKSALSEATRMNTHPLAQCADLLRGAGAKD